MYMFKARSNFRVAFIGTITKTSMALLLKEVSTFKQSLHIMCTIVNSMHVQTDI